MDSKIVETNLKDDLNNLKIIQNLTSIFSLTLDINNLLDLLLNKLIILTEGESGLIVINKNDEFIKTTLKGINDDEAQKIYLSLDRYFKNSFLDNEVKIIQENLNSIIIPLKVNEKIFGFVNINGIKKKVDLELIHTITILVSQKLSKIFIYNDLERKIKLKDILIEVSNSIEKVFVLKDVFDVVMKRLASNFGIIRGMLVLLDRVDQKKLSVFTAYNLTEAETSRGIYKVGEGIVGKVMEIGQPISIPDINKDETFLNRMQIKRDKTNAVSFIAVPIRISGITLGVLAIEKYFESSEILKDEEDMLFLIAGIIANKVKIYQRMSEEKSVLLEENLNLKKELYEKYGIDNIIGKNKKMLDIFELIKMVEDTNTSILILGESGTGKELVAKALHFNSKRCYGPFVSINCAAIPENLIESELFGYKKGAFTGAGSDKKGKFLLADGGILFLDEIGEMPLYLQAKLLRAIQEKEIEPVGSELRIKIDIRILSATNKDPKDLIKSGKLREDLYYRLNVVEIKIPPLKERKDDIPLLIQHFIEKYSKINSRKIKRISPEAMKVLQAYHWPGNVRELENVIERAVLLSKGSNIEIHELPSFIVQGDLFEKDELFIEKWIDNFVKNEKDFGKTYDNFMKIIEKEFLLKAFLQNGRNKIKTAQFLGINRNTLRSKMNLYKIKM